MVDFLASKQLFALPSDEVYRFPRDYPYPHEVYAPVWEGTVRLIVWCPK